MSKKLTPKQLEVLKRGQWQPLTAGTSEAPSPTLEVLKTRGLIKWDHARKQYALTADGCAEIGVRLVDVQVNYARRNFEDRNTTNIRTNIFFWSNGDVSYSTTRSVDFQWFEYQMERALDAAIELTRAELRAMKGE